MLIMFARGGWSVTSLEEDLKTSLPRRFLFQTDVKILDMARRGGAEFGLAGRHRSGSMMESGR
jgi:hypothetical protein